MAYSLSSKQFEAKEVKQLLGIDKNRLFYWINTHRLVKPEIEEASGTGTRAKFSLKNLLELAVVERMIDAGFDLKKIKEIKGKLDKFNPEKKRGFNIFKKAFEEYLSSTTSIHIYRTEHDISLYLYTWIRKKGQKRRERYWTPANPFKLGLDERPDMYSVLRLDIGKMAISLKEKLEHY
jgi:DNA-binding transcriptional MerR regulator